MFLGDFFYADKAACLQVFWIECVFKHTVTLT